MKSGTTMHSGVEGQRKSLSLFFFVPVPPRWRNGASRFFNRGMFQQPYPYVAQIQCQLTNKMDDEHWIEPLKIQGAGTIKGF